MSRRRFTLKLKLNFYILSVATLIYCITIGYVSYRLTEITYSGSVQIVNGSTREYQNKVSEDLTAMLETARTLRNSFKSYPKLKSQGTEPIFESLLKNYHKKSLMYMYQSAWQWNLYQQEYYQKTLASISINNFHCLSLKKYRNKEGNY